MDCRSVDLLSPDVCSAGICWRILERWSSGRVSRMDGKNRRPQEKEPWSPRAGECPADHLRNRLWLCRLRRSTQEVDRSVFKLKEGHGSPLANPWKHLQGESSCQQNKTSSRPPDSACWLTWFSWGSSLPKTLPTKAADRGHTSSHHLKGKGSPKGQKSYLKLCPFDSQHRPTRESISEVKWEKEKAAGIFFLNPRCADLSVDWSNREWMGFRKEYVRQEIWTRKDLHPQLCWWNLPVRLLSWEEHLPNYCWTYYKEIILWIIQGVRCFFHAVHWYNNKTSGPRK